MLVWPWGRELLKEPRRKILQKSLPGEEQCDLLQGAGAAQGDPTERLPERNTCSRFPPTLLFPAGPSFIGLIWKPEGKVPYSQPLGQNTEQIQRAQRLP